MSRSPNVTERRLIAVSYTYTHFQSLPSRFCAPRILRTYGFDLTFDTLS